ncbi:MAG: substrate-binding domain-containing protein [Hyphomicrobiales bacterium]|nr:substrate-binding domain-containing protein [Hyphomicrobiales bacterium]
MIRIIGRIAAAIAALVLPVTFACAADINVYGTIGMRNALEQLTPLFQKQSGATLALTWGTAAMLTKRIEAGEPADVVILTSDNVDALNTQGKVAPDTETTLAKSSIAVAVKVGAAKPDISTADSLKQALLKAKSIAYSNPAYGGASGVYFAKLLDRLGIADQMKAKTKYPSAGGNSAGLLVDGQVELAVQQKPELMNIPGVDIAGLLPADLNKVTAFAAAVTASSKSADVAKALIKFLQSPAAVKVLKTSGFETE